MHWIGVSIGLCVFRQLTVNMMDGISNIFIYPSSLKNLDSEGLFVLTRAYCGQPELRTGLSPETSVGKAYRKGAGESKFSEVAGTVN